jgi:hypothetical protein
VDFDDENKNDPNMIFGAIINHKSERARERKL